ncbi:MAG: hydrogenase formation protein HypD, partial [Bacillota bacterium]
FRDPELGRRILRAIRRRVDELGRPLRLMEVCGTHTMAFSASGLRDLLRGYVDLRSGPGCPVCVTPSHLIDQMIALTRRTGSTICTFGDMLRVPGSRSSLLREKTRGADVRTVYSPLAAVQLARKQPGRTVIFLGVGFETTAPVVGLAMRRAVDEGLGNFRIFSALKILSPALRALLSDAQLPLDGLILPGHVAAVTGRRSLDFVAADFAVPAVVTGFEPVDLLHGVSLLAEMVAGGRASVLNAYPRAVHEEGNPEAHRVIARFFQPAAAGWRGLGVIADSGLGLRDAVRHLDAGPLVPREEVPLNSEQTRGCRCAEVLTGRVLPTGCPLFGTACDPAHPVGPCMVSGEGACAAHYRFHREEDAGVG